MLCKYLLSCDKGTKGCVVETKMRIMQLLLIEHVPNKKKQQKTTENLTFFIL